jgi:hypothetical protein
VGDVLHPEPSSSSRERPVIWQKRSLTRTKRPVESVSDMPAADWLKKAERCASWVCSARAASRSAVMSRTSMIVPCSPSSASVKGLAV